MDNKSQNMGSTLFPPNGPKIVWDKMLREAQENSNNINQNKDFYKYLLTQNHNLVIALHDAINSPKGVVPDSARDFYDPNMYE